MKIVYVLWSTAVMGGLETVTVLKVNKLVELGYDVAVITRRQNGLPPFSKIDDRVTQKDIAVEWENLHSIANPVKRYCALQRAYAEYRKRILGEISALQPDIIVLTSFTEAEILKRDIKKMKAMTNGRAKIILESHSSKYFSLNLPSRNTGGVRQLIGRILDRRKTQLYEKLPSLFDAFVALTREDREQWPHVHNIEVIPNPRRFETDEIADYTAHKVITLGRYSKEKGHLDLIEMWSEIIRRYPNWTLEIVGDGYMRDAMQSKIDELGLQGSVLLHPATKNVIEKLKEASVFVFTSYSEGFPMALAEAQAISLPIVSYACKCGPRDMITDGEDGFLVDVGNKWGG